MAKRRTIKADELKGIFIHQQPEKNRTVFYDIFTRKGYILTNEEAPSFIFYTSLIPMAIIAGFLCIEIFEASATTAVIVGVVLWLLAEILFRVLYFYKLPEAKNFTPTKKDNLFVGMAKTYNMTRLIMLFVMLAALSVVMFFYGKMQGYTGLNLILTYVVCGVTACMAISTLISIFIRKKNNY